MSDKVKIFALGGLDEEGKSCLVVEINDEIYVVSCGINYPDRTMPGVDYVIPDFTYLKENKDRVKAYLLPHGHDDEMGGLVYVYNEVPAPVYASRSTLMMLETFSRHAGVNIKFDEHPVEASSSFYIGARRIYFFQTSHNIAQSSGIAISTSLGNVVVTSDFVIENNASPSYKTDLNMIAKVAENPTLVLLQESLYAARPGYTAPKYKLIPLIEKEVKDAPGRTFVALYGSNFYNVDELVSLAIASHKRIVPYDDDTADLIKAMQASKQIVIPRDNFAPLDDINRYRAQDLIVLMLGFGTRLFRKIALLAAGQSERLRPILLDANDTFNVRIDITALDNDALVEVAKNYAKEKNYSIDEFGILALHTRISSLQTIDHTVTVDEVKGIVDEAIGYAEKKTPGHLMDVIFRKRYDEDDMVILREKDFQHY